MIDNRSSGREQHELQWQQKNSEVFFFRKSLLLHKLHNLKSFKSSVMSSTAIVSFSFYLVVNRGLLVRIKVFRLLNILSFASKIFI
jgi:hypothetical protein